MTAPDPVITLFRRGGTIQDDAAALATADPKGVDPNIGKQHDKLYDRQSKIERLAGVS